MIRTLALAAALAFAVPASAQTTVVAPRPDTPVDVNIVGATATLVDLSGTNRGRAVVRPTPTGHIFITVSATGLPRGWHGVHVVERGDCDPATGFASAGAILGEGAHGFLAQGGPRAGGLPNQMVQEDLTLVAEIFNDRLGWSRTGPAALFDADGSAIVVTEGRDDYQTQPDGSAGTRLLCGVFEIDR